MFRQDGARMCEAPQLAESCVCRRSDWRAPTPVGEYVAPAAASYAATADITQLLEPPIPDKFVAPVSADAYTSLSHMTEYVTPAPVDLYAVIDHAAPASTGTCATPAPVTEHAAPAHTVTFTAPSPVTEDVAPAPSSPMQHQHQ